MYNIRVGFTHPNVDPADITAALGLEPYMNWKAGASRWAPNGKRLPGVSPVSRWNHVLRFEKTNGLNAEVEALIGKLEKATAFTKTLVASGGRGFVCISFPGELYQGHSIPAALLARLSAMDLELGIEVFPDWDTGKELDEECEDAA